MATERIYIGELLVADNIITKEQLNEGLREQKKSGGLLGMILVKMGYITPEQLTQYSAIQEEKQQEAGLAEKKRMRIGEMLIASGEITEKQLKEALEEQKKNGQKLGMILLDKNLIDRSTLVRYLTKQSQMVIDKVGMINYEAKGIVADADKNK